MSTHLTAPYLVAVTVPAHRTDAAGALLGAYTHLLPANTATQALEFATAWAAHYPQAAIAVIHRTPAWDTTLMQMNPPQ